jgi:hypothetical protein
MTTTLSVSDALRALPMEAPERSMWPELAAQLPRKHALPKWPFALAASVLLVSVIWLGGSHFPGKPDPAAAPAASPLQQSMARSAQLEPYFYQAQDDSISSASVIAANLNLEEQLRTVDARLAANPDETEALSLWQERVALLDKGISLNHANARMHADGQNYDLVLASLN